MIFKYVYLFILLGALKVTLLKCQPGHVKPYNVFPLPSECNTMVTPKALHDLTPTYLFNHVLLYSTLSFFHQALASPVSFPSIPFSKAMVFAASNLSVCSRISMERFCPTLHLAGPFIRSPRKYHFRGRPSPTKLSKVNPPYYL